MEATCKNLHENCFHGYCKYRYLVYGVKFVCFQLSCLFFRSSGGYGETIYYSFSQAFVSLLAALRGWLSRAIDLLLAGKCGNIVHTFSFCHLGMIQEALQPMVVATPSYELIYIGPYDSSVLE